MAGSSPAPVSPKIGPAPTVAAATAPSMAGDSPAAPPPPPPCPAAWTDTSTRVPAVTAATPADRLLPETPVASARLCAYLGSNMAPMAGRPLSGQTVLAGGLADMTTDLRWLPPAAGDETCNAMGGPQTNFLLSLRLASGGSMWVFAAEDVNHCLRSTNGRYQTLHTSGPQFAAGLRAGRWVPAPPEQDPSTCGAAGRFGHQDALVPTGVTAVRICRAGRTTVRITEPSVFQPLLAGLAAFPTEPSIIQCHYPIVDAATKKEIPLSFYDVAFDYPSGPSVRLVVARGCRPALDNTSLQSADATGIIPMLEVLLSSPRR